MLFDLTLVRMSHKIPHVMSGRRFQIRIFPFPFRQSIRRLFDNTGIINNPHRSTTNVFVGGRARSPVLAPSGPGPRVPVHSRKARNLVAFESERARPSEPE